MTLYDKVVEFVDISFGGRSKSHFERTVYWLEKFSQVFSEAHKIAAYSHDIERGVSGEKDRDYLNPDFIRMHQEVGAAIMENFLRENNASEKTIEKVKHLISKHEVGGDAEQDALMDADSVSFMETNAKNFVLNRVKEEGYQKIKGKLDWMFDRITTPERKSFARENYNEWMTKLAEYE